MSSDKNLTKEILIKKFNNSKIILNAKYIEIKIDYLEIRDENNLLPSIENKNSRLFLAFYIGSIRIIDNFILY